MPKFCTVIKKTAVSHSANTQRDMGVLVKVDLTREEMFKAFESKERDLVLFPLTAAGLEQAEKQALSECKAEAVTRMMESTFSKDAELIKRYGRMQVLQRMEPVSILYQVNVDDVSVLAPYKVTEGAFVVSSANKSKVIVEVATIEGVRSELTEAYAKETQSKTLTVTPEPEQYGASCVIS